MRIRPLVLTAMLFSPMAAMADGYHHQRGYTTQRTCYKETYREEYISGKKSSQGYVKSFTDRIKIPCFSSAKVHNLHNNYRSIPSYNYSRTRYYKPTTTYRISRSKPSSSSCRSSRATGGLLGGGLAAAVSKKDIGVGQFL